MAKKWEWGWTRMDIQLPNIWNYRMGCQEQNRGGNGQYEPEFIRQNRRMQSFTTEISQTHLTDPGCTTKHHSVWPMTRESEMDEKFLDGLPEHGINLRRYATKICLGLGSPQKLYGGMGRGSPQPINTRLEKRHGDPYDTGNSIWIRH